jgi:hypothetical protein
MRRLRVGVIDLVSKAPTRALYARIMNANVATIMPQIVAAWCQSEGHEVRFLCYTGLEDLARELPSDCDLVFISAFTHAAQTAYALSNRLRSQGAVTALGGPHARCYPEDARRYFDYVFGLTDRQVLRDVLGDCAPHAPEGVRVGARAQPRELPGVRERWPFIETILPKAPFVKITPVIGSLGCPYRCSFCIDADVPYQALDFERLKEDLRFLRRRFERPWVSWYDPNFGVRFDETLDAIEEAVPPGSLAFIAESSLSLLSEARAARLARNGFVAILPGIESWFDLGHKAGSGRRTGLEKVLRVSERVEAVRRHVPFVQTNFVLGLDADAGPEPFELTKRFLDLTPAAFPAISLHTAFGEGAPANLELQREGRVLEFPFHVMSNLTMNVRPHHYSWPEFYRGVRDVVEHAFSWRGIARRWRATEGAPPRAIGLLRAVSTEGWGRIRYYRDIVRRLEADRDFRGYYEGETNEIPAFYTDQVRRDLGPLWDWLPAGAMRHDVNSYLKATREPSRVAVVKARRTGEAERSQRRSKKMRW